MKESTQLSIFGWCGMFIMFFCAMMITAYESMAVYLLDHNPNLQINLVFFNGKLIDVYPFTLLFFPIALFPFALWLFVLYNNDKKARINKQPNLREEKQ